VLEIVRDDANGFNDGVTNVIVVLVLVDDDVSEDMFVFCCCDVLTTVML
jgi:hypothetical protein